MSSTQTISRIPVEAMCRAYITISVDDGHPADLRTADLLSKHELPATFYVPARNSERAVLPPSQLREIGKHFELGGHTMNHVPLNSVSDERAWLEILEGKTWLEDVQGKAVESFCYPRGKHSKRIADMVRKAGFVGARSCFLNRTDFPQNPFLWGVSTQAHNHSKMIQVRHALIEGNFQGALNFMNVHKAATDWTEHFRYALDRVQAEGGVAHLYFHSWEIEQNGDWQKLDSMLRSISQRSINKVTNGELFGVWQSQRKSQLN